MGIKMSQAFPSKYLSVGDLQGRTVTATIAEVNMEQVGQGNQADNKPVVYFQGKDKGLVLNQTNANMIVSVYGDDSDAWIGQAIQIRPEKTSFQGKIVDCLRVYPAQNSQPQPVPTPPPVNDSIHPAIGAGDEIPF